MCPGPDGPTAGREIFSFYWQKKIFGQFASLEAVKFGEKFTPSLCQPDWPPGPGPGSQIQHLSLRVYFFILLWFFLWVLSYVCMCRNIFSGKRKMCWFSYLRVCGWWQHWACCEASGGDNQNVTNKNSGQLSTIVRTVKLGLVSVLMSPLSRWRGSK